MKVPPRVFLGAVLLFCAGCESAPPSNLGATILNHRTEVAVTSVDPRWTSYGTYLKAATDSVQAQWDLLRQSNLNAITDGSTVSVTFVMNSNGQVVRFISHDDLGTGASPYTIHICLEAIKDAQPFALWPEEMIGSLGNEQKIVMTFFFPS
jgi:hypothetical protein